MGYQKSYIRALMTHTDEKTTIYLTNPGNLKDDNYHRVEARMSLNNLEQIEL
jgi:hypothetical protein